ncbi:guanylate-binding protein 4-like isoform X9 [Dermochelys coriacea]|uniref:guanylate-binding protein 4-like isoform X9 n=1 Tax=Dermochelys coriacea TaxID=27794 RepID=UPI001CA9DD7C|nr:guanylate-binding protein 4-like isoform X9 [Dermochelys coriacea]
MDLTLGREESAEKVKAKASLPTARGHFSACCTPTLPEPGLNQDSWVLSPAPQPRAPDPHTEAMEPVCLVEPVPSSGTLRVNPAALGLLRGLTRPLHVLAVFGPRGTGKSFLMDQLAGQGEGFPCSPGIWVWCLPHPTQPDQALVLLDTEGFPEQEGDKTQLSRLFLLNVLLSSVLVYNTRSEGDPQRQLDRLTYVRDLPRLVQVLDECSWENSFLLSSVLPNFVWCLRDVAPDPCLDEMLEATGHELDSALSSPQDLEDSPSSCIQRLFPCRKLFCFCSPRADGGHGEPPSPADQLHPTFQEQMGRFKDYALSRSPKTVVGNRVVDGTFLADFLERVVDLLSRDKPVLLSEICNDLQQEGDDYSVGYPTDTTGDAPPRRAAASAAQPSVPDPKRECVVPLQMSQPALPVLAQAAPGTAQPGAMEEPMCLIENRPGRELQLNQRALSLLQSFRQPVVVVAIAGLYRTGKSYLLNRLASKDQGGFSLGATVQSHTKGIWMWCLPHPRRACHTLVLLDTEGLGDVEKGDTKNDAWIFALAVLLSSTLVYNSLGTINQCALEQLHYVTELTEHIKVKAAGKGGRQEGEKSAQFVQFFPAFVWAVRDFTLQLKLDGQEITEDEYLENALKRREVLGNLAVTYVDAICSGTVPCMESAVLALAQIENSAAVGEAVAVYEEQLRWRAALPTESVQELLELHAQCEREALRAFMVRAFKDDDRSFQGELMHRLEEQKQELYRRNELASSDRCTAILLELSDEMEDQIGQRVYLVPGGYQHFQNDRQQMVERYRQVPGKGIKAEEVLQEFLQSKEAVAQTILQTDQALTEKEKETAAERARAEMAEREQEVLKQKEAELQQKLEDQDRSYQENLRQLEEKLEDERKKLLEEQGKMMDQKLKEQEALLREGFREEARRLENEIRGLQQQNEEIQKPSWIQSALGTLGDVASLVLPGFVGKAAGVVTNLVRRLF